jgi:GT2 family glycosyltransferase
MDISVVIPNYNGQELLKKNLPKVFAELAAYKAGKTEVVVVDDKSTDESLEVLDNFQEKNLRVLVNDKNLGFAPTVNKGVKVTSAQIIILLNTDVYPEKDFLAPLVKHFNDEKLFAVGCLDRSVENGEVVLRGRGLGEWKRGFLVHRRGEVDKTNTLWISGGSGAFRKSIWEKLGGFNELYAPFYYEDIDLSYRALKSGYKIAFEPKSVVVHEHEKGAIKTKYSESQVKTIAYRNQFIFAWENATDYSLQLANIFWLPFHLVKALISSDWAFYKGFFRALFLLPKIIKSSLNYQKIFIKKDSEVIRIANA